MPQPENPSLQNQSVRASIRQAIINKMHLAWGKRSEQLGMVLIIFDSKTGEIITSTKGEPQNVIEAIAAINKKASSGEILEARVG